MKVAMIGQFPDPGHAATGGVERVIAVLAPEIARHAEVAIFVPGASVDAEADHEGIRVIYRKRAIGPGALRYWSYDALRIREAVDAFKPDIVHLQGMAGWGLWLRLPTIFTLHGVVDRDLLAAQRAARWGGLALRIAARTLRWIEDVAADKSGHVIVINPYVGDAIPRINRNRLYPISNPVDPIYIHTPHATPESRERRVLVVGRVCARKDTLRAVRIAARVLAQDSSTRLTVCGAPETASYLQHCREAVANVADRVEFTGNLPPRSLIECMDRAACLLMTSEQETAPLVISEANARGVPVVVPRRFGIPYMVTAGENGLFLTGSNLDNDAEVLLSALNRNWDRTAIRCSAKAAYDPGQIAKATLAAYEAVLSAKG